MPIHHWLDRKKNLSPGDVVLVKYEAKYGKPSYRLAKILVTKKDSDGLVRTVRVGMRPRDAREPNLPYKSKNLFEVEMPIQRLCLLVPVEDVPLAENHEGSGVVNQAGPSTKTEAGPNTSKTLDLPAVEYTTEDVHQFQ